MASECTEEDQARLAEWLAVELGGVELNRDRPAEAVVARCRKDRLEPPTPGRVARLVGRRSAPSEERFCAATVGRLSAATRSRLDDLIAEDTGAETRARAAEASRPRRSPNALSRTGPSASRTIARILR